MNREENSKLHKLQGCVLKVNIHCNGCKQKVKKVLQKIDGVHAATIDADEGMVTVTGYFDPAIIIKKLAKARKHAELLAPKYRSNNKPQFLNPHPEFVKGQQMNNGSNHKGQQLQPKLQQKPKQVKGFKDLKILPHMKGLKIPFKKDKKSVKFETPSDDDDDWSDFDFDEDLDSLESDFEIDFKDLKMKPTKAPVVATTRMMADKREGGSNGVSGGNCKKVCGENLVRVNSNKVAGLGHDLVRVNSNKAAGLGHGRGHGGNYDFAGNVNSVKLSKNGDVKNEVGEGNPMMNPRMMGQKLHGIDVNQMGKIGNMHAGEMGKIGTIPLAGGGAPLTYMQGGMAVTPEMKVAAAAAAGGPYQQQYMAAMLQQQQQQQQQQQRMMMMMAMNGQDRVFNPMMAMNGQDRVFSPPMMAMNGQDRVFSPPMMAMNGQDRVFNPMMMAYPGPPTVSYAAPAQAQGEPYTNMFNDENTGGCSIM